MLRRRVVCLVLIVALISLLVIGCAAPQKTPESSKPAEPAKPSEPAKPAEPPKSQPKGKTVLKWPSASPGGSWYVIASGLADIWQRNVPNLEVQVLPGGGSTNAIVVGKGEAELGMCQSYDAMGVYKAIEPYKEVGPHIMALLTLDQQAFHAAAWKDSGIKKFADLKGKRVNLKPKGFSSTVINEAVLEAHGVKESDLKQAARVNDSDAADMMRDGHLDVSLAGGGIPDSAFIDLASTRPITLIPMEDAAREKLVQLNPGLGLGVIPKGTYNGIDEDVETLVYRLTVVVSDNVPEDLIYEMCKAVGNNLEALYASAPALKKLKPEDLCTEIGVPYHPGALKYYKEKGWKK